jgi:hypothetical protein
LKDKHIIVPVWAAAFSEIDLLEVNRPFLGRNQNFIKNLHDGSSGCVKVVSEVFLAIRKGVRSFLGLFVVFCLEP